MDAPPGVGGCHGMPIMGVPEGCVSPGAGDTEHRGHGVLGTQGTFRGLGTCRDRTHRHTPASRWGSPRSGVGPRRRGRRAAPGESQRCLPPRPAPGRRIKRRGPERRRPVPEPRALRMYRSGGRTALGGTSRDLSDPGRRMLGGTGYPRLGGCWADTRVRDHRLGQSWGYHGQLGGC